MGGQACILYGAAEFSRDVDIAILASEENIRSLRRALEELAAAPIFFPPLSISYLERGHACHFRCHHRECDGLRLDVMTRMRGCDAFPVLWDRRTVLDLPGLGEVDVLSLRDLVQCKKTQRDKDWAMLRRLVEIDYLAGRESPTEADAQWWLAELRSPLYLDDVGRRFPACVRSVTSRPWLSEALRSGLEAVGSFLLEEERRIRDEDRAFWRPLREELERMRLER
jgi:hypothetical protein